MIMTIYHWNFPFEIFKEVSKVLFNYIKKTKQQQQSNLEL